MSDLTPHDSPLNQVHEGMRVIDSAGEDVGTVESVTLGDPEAATAGGQENPPQAAFQVEDLGEKLDEQDRARLRRVGSVYVDAKGFLAGHRYAAGDDVARVEGDVVHLSVAKDQLFG